MDGKVYLARRRNLLGVPHQIFFFSIQRYGSYYFIYPVTQFFSNFHLLTFIYTKSSSSCDQLPYITITWSTAVDQEKYTAPCYRVEYANSDRKSKSVHTRYDQVVVLLCRIGHYKIIHSYLLTRDDSSIYLSMMFSPLNLL